MSFLFGKKSKPPPPSNPLPAATRDITSSHGPSGSNGPAPRDISLDKTRPTPPSQASTPAASLNNSLNSLQNQALSLTAAAPLDAKPLVRDRSESNAPVCTSRHGSFCLVIYPS